MGKIRGADSAYRRYTALHLVPALTYYYPCCEVQQAEVGVHDGLLAHHEHGDLGGTLGHGGKGKGRGGG